MDIATSAWVKVFKRRPVCARMGRARTFMACLMSLLICFATHDRAALLLVSAIADAENGGERASDEEGARETAAKVSRVRGFASEDRFVDLDFTSNVFQDPRRLPRYQSVRPPLFHLRGAGIDCRC